jgi:signal transduction histidine kinase
MTDLVDALAPARLPLPASATHDVEAIHRRLRRLALDVHDGPIQSLVAIGYGLTALRERLRTNADADQVAEMMDELASAEQQLRQLITTLERGERRSLEMLHEIADNEVMTFQRRCTAMCELEVTHGVEPDSHSQEIAIRSVLHEALMNVAKHARAENVMVRLLADEDEILLDVEDDGDGFDPRAVGGDRIGIASMRERLQFLGGSFAIESMRGGPTRITAKLPRWRAGL